MKKVLHIFVWMFVFVMLTGCGKFDPQADAVSIDKDGRLTRAFVDTFVDESNRPYDVDEIRSMMQEELDTYNYKFGVDHITLTECAMEGDLLTIMIECDAAKYYEDYCSYFNDDFVTEESDVEFFVGQISEAGKYDFNASFVDAKGEAVSGASIRADEKLHVVVCNEPMEVYTPGKICYVSSNVEMLGGKQARVADTGVLTRAYIIYK